MLTPACFPSLRGYVMASRTDDRKQLSDEQWFLIEDSVSLGAAHPRRRAASRSAVRGPRGFAVAAAQRRPMARFTRPLPLGVHLPTPAARMDGTGDPSRGLVATRRTGRRVGTGRLGTLDRRRHVLPGKKRGFLVGHGRKGSGTTVLVLMDGDRTPLGAVIAAAHEHESRHIERLVDSAVVELPDEHRLLYDGAADSDPLRERLACAASI